MKTKKKLKKVEKLLEGYNRDNISMISAFHAIRDIVDGTHQDEEEPEPEFEPGDKVGVDDPVLDYEFHVDALEGHGGLKGQIKVSTWVEPQDIEKI